MKIETEDLKRAIEEERNEYKKLVPHDGSSYEAALVAFKAVLNRAINNSVEHIKTTGQR